MNLIGRLRRGASAEPAPVAGKTVSTTFGDIGTADWLHLDSDPMDIPAVVGISTLISSAAAMVEFRVVDDEGQPVTTGDLPELLRNPHRSVMGAYTWRADLAMSFTARGEALLHILRVGARVVGLRVVPIETATPLWIDGGVWWQDTSRASPIMISPRDAIYMRGPTLRRANAALGGLRRGMSRIHTLSDVAAGETARQRHGRDHAERGMQPAWGYQFPPEMTAVQADEYVQKTENRHRGQSRWGRILAVGGGATLVPVPAQTARDSQAVEQTQLTVSQAAWLWSVPGSIAGIPGAIADHTGGDWRRFATLCAAPPMLTIASDMEARLASVGQHIVISTTALMQYDPLVVAQVEHQQAQTGTRLVDELRKNAGLKPLPPVPTDPLQTPGSVPQITPVGGAPNAPAQLPSEAR